MSGTKTEHQIRYWYSTFDHKRYNTGSLWPSLGLGPVTQLNGGETQGRLEWDDLRTTEAQVPNWRQRKAAGDCVTTDLTGNRRKLLGFSAGFYEDRWKTNQGQPTEFSYVYTIQGNLFRHECEASGYISYENADNQARMKWFRSARSAQQKLQAGVVAGELGQTLRGILHTAKQLRQGIGAFVDEVAYFYKRGPAHRRRRRGKPRRLYARHEAEKYLADTWLSYVFGWKPLINDLDNAMELLATDNSILTDYEDVVGEGKESCKGFKVMPPGEYWDYDLCIEDTWDVKYYGKVYRFIPGPFQSTMSLRAGLDTSSWLPTVWELIPYSFLVDYFVDVQDVVSSHAFNMTTLKWCSRTQRNSIQSRVVNVRPNAGPSGMYTGKVQSPGECTWEYSSTQRRREGPPGFVQTSFRIPGLDSWKWVNMAALLKSSTSMRPYVW
jgi:hypothetical protein